MSEEGLQIHLETLIDWPEVLRPLTALGWYWTKGRFVRLATGEVHTTPWLHSHTRIPGQDKAGDCKFLQTVLFEAAYKKTAVPKFCFDCYKVVTVPRNIIEAHKIYKYQQSTPTWASKVGCEMRGYVSRLWGAYWYCRGLEEGRERYADVRAWVDENLGGDVVVFLKRGCTEFEQALGDSSKWEPHIHADTIEAEAYAIVDHEQWTQPQSLPMVSSIMRQWIKWSQENDTPPTTYHEEEEE